MEEDFLKDLPPEKAFWFHNGVTVRNIYELAREINVIDESTFKYHCNKEHDDFANWIGGAIGDIWLSQRLRIVKSKKAYLSIINKRIRYIEKRRISLERNRKIAERFRALLKDYSHVWLIIILIVSTSIITALIYFEYHGLMNIRALDEKISYIEARNSCFNNYFNDQLLRAKALINNTEFNVDAQCVLNYSTSLRIPAEVLESNPEIIPRENIQLGQDRILIYLNSTFLSVFANSSSMNPVITHNTKALEIAPGNVNELHVGDIIAYQSGNELIVHRIVDIGNDAEGWFAITKGDNNNAVDTEKIRYNMIKGKIAVLLY